MALGNDDPPRVVQRASKNVGKPQEFKNRAHPRFFNKRGIIFSFMALLAVGLLFFLLVPQQTSLSSDRAIVVRDRVRQADNFVKDLRENFLPNAVYVSSYRTLNALANYTARRGFFASEAAFKTAFAEVLLNSTLGGANINTQLGAVVYDRNLSSLLGEIETSSADYLGIATNFSYGTIRINIFQGNFTQTGDSNTSMGPWRVAVNLSVSYTVRTDVAHWNRSDDIVVVFSDEGLPDPLYLGSTNGAYSNYITRTNYSVWNIAAFKDHVTRRAYAVESTAPGYLQRFYNDTSPSPSTCCGIESFVYDAAENYYTPPPYKNVSYVDCAFFGGQCTRLLNSPASAWPLNRTWYVNQIKTPTYDFKIDQYRAFARYNITQSELTES